MLHCMKQHKLFKAICNMFVQGRICHYLPLARFTCECESPGLTSSAVDTSESKNEMCSKHLASLLNCPHKTAISVMADFPDVAKQNPLHIKKTLSILLQHCNIKDVLKYPGVFCLKPEKIGERVLILQEIGTITLTVDQVSRFSTLMKKPLATLMKDKVISSACKIIDNMLLAFDCPKETATFLKEKVASKNIRTGAREFRTHVMQNYLHWKLKCSIVTIKKIFRTYPSISSHSCQTIKQTLDILTNKFHFSEEKICSNGFVLELYPTNLENILSSVPVLAGKDIRYCAVRVPRILCMSPKKLLETEKIAKENNYTDEQLMRCLSVYNLKPATVQQRLETIDNEEELAIRKFSPNVLQAVRSHKLVLRHLRQQKETEIAPSSLYRLLISDTAELERTHSFVDTFFYLAKVFDKTKEEVREKVKEYQCINFDSLSNVKKVTEYLLDNGVSKEQFWHGVYIVFYSFDAVKEQFLKLPNYKELHPFDEWKTHPNFVHLLLYYLEKESDGALGNYTGKYEAIIESHAETNN